MAKLSAKGTTVTIGSDAIGGLTDATWPVVETEYIDGKSLDSNEMDGDVATGFKVLGESTLNGHYVASDAGQAALNTNAGTTNALQVTWKGPGNVLSKTYTCHIKSFTPNGKTGALFGWTAVIKVVGAAAS